MTIPTSTVTKTAVGTEKLLLSRFSVGVGDRFAHQAKAQLQACQLAVEDGVEITTVWNKSNREHQTVGFEPGTVLAAAERAVSELGWKLPFHCDADHITLKTVDRFIASCDFYTLDVADCIGLPAEASSVTSFVAAHPELQQRIELTGKAGVLQLSASEVERYASKYLFAVKSAAQIYRHIAEAKGEGKFITEVSMDETDTPQTMAEMRESNAQGEEDPSAWARLGRRRWAICAMLSIAASGSLLVLFLVVLIAPGLKKVELAA